MARSNPHAVWNRLLVIAASTDDAGLYWVGDVIEDLLIFHAAGIVPRLEAELAANASLQRAFVTVVPSTGDAELDDRLLALRTEIENAHQ